MKHHQRTIGKSDEWLTPRWILNPLGWFDLDPCTPENMPWSTAKRMLTKKDNGLTAKWEGRVWLNPPFNRKERALWMMRMAAHNNGIMLVPAACQTEPFRKFVFGKASGILMLDRRPVFLGVDGEPVMIRDKKTGKKREANSGCTICLVAYGQDNLRALNSSGLGTVLREAA